MFSNACYILAKNFYPYNQCVIFDLNHKIKSLNTFNLVINETFDLVNFFLNFQSFENFDVLLVIDS
jgi:hypothetical protein